VVTGEGVFQTNSQSYQVLGTGGNLYPGTLLYQNDYYDPSGNPDPILMLPFAFVDVGYMWGDAFIEKRVGGTIYYPRVYQFAILGLEDVTVPAGTFTNCVKIGRFRGGQADRIEWRAKGIGSVKMIYAEEPYPTSYLGDPNLNISSGYNQAYVLESLGD
jgi:hypothetical protein